jgi:hypothetical protein
MLYDFIIYDKDTNKYLKSQYMYPEKLYGGGDDFLLLRIRITPGICRWV